MGKFIQTSIGLQRTPPKPIEYGTTGIGLRVQEETLTITLEYIGFGDTNKITNEQLIDKLKVLLGDEI